MKYNILNILLLSLINCNGQNKNEKKETDYLKNENSNNLNVNIKIKKNNIMKTFDIETFEKNKGKQGYPNEYYYKSSDNSDVREFSTATSPNNPEIKYQREVSKEFSPYKSVWIFYKNGILYTEGNFFNDSHVSIYRKFDKNGKLIQEINDDKNFKHSFEQIHDIIIKEKKINIYDTRQAVAVRADTPFGNTGIEIYYQIHVLKSDLVDGIWYSQPDYSFIIDDATLKEINSKDNKSN